MRGRRIALYGATLPLAVICADKAFAQALDQKALMRIVEDQARRIDQLESRLVGLEAQLEAKGGALPGSPPVTATASAEANAGASEKSAPSPPLSADQPPVVRRTVFRGADAEAAPPPATGQPEKAGVTFVNGMPRINSADGRTWFRPRGRLFVDGSTTSGSNQGRNITGTSLTSARLGMEGAFGNLSWALEGDFARNRVVWKSAFVNLRHTILGQQADLSVGNRFNDRSMDGSSGLGSSPFPDFSVVGALVLPYRGFWGVGVQERIYGPNWHVSLQATGEDPNNVGDNDDSFTLVSRAHWNPVKSKKATVHLGVWGFHESIAPGATGIVRSSALAGDFNTLVRLSPGGVTGIRKGDALGGELALFLGPFWTQNEWGRRTIRRGAEQWSYDAYSLDAGVFLFGASPPYDARRGAWGRVRLTRPVTDGGSGAMALKFRYESVDFTDLPGGGKGHSFTTGVNWHLTDIARIMVDLIHWQVDNRSGADQGIDDGRTMNMRFQLQF